jgi:hypothetical protein
VEFIGTKMITNSIMRNNTIISNINIRISSIKKVVISHTITKGDSSNNKRIIIEKEKKEEVPVEVPPMKINN